MVNDTAFDSRPHCVSWACRSCGRSGHVALLRHEADPDVVMKSICDDHQRHSPLCLTKRVGIGKFGVITYLPARNLHPRWWRIEEGAEGKRYVFLTCRFVDGAGVEREETEDECLAHVASIPWPPK